MKSEHDIVSSRLFDCPRERVYGAFADGEVLARWWGPKGFSCAFRDFDLRPGGAWRFTMTGPDGATYPIEKRFVEVTPADRIVYDNISAIHGFRMTMTFADESDRTRLTWHMRFESADEAAKVRQFILAANEENFDRLEEVLSAS